MMSRIGKQPISLPSGVSVTVDNDTISAKGPKGDLQLSGLPNVSVAVTDDLIQVNRENDEKLARSNHGLMRALIQNMVTGVSQGFEIKLELNGVGYRVSAQGQELKFNLGFSHEVTYKVPERVQVTIDQN